MDEPNSGEAGDNPGGHVTTDQAAVADPAPPATPPAQPEKKKAVLVAWLRRLLVLVVVVAAGYQLVANWGEVSGTLTAIPWHSLLLSQLTVVAGIVAGTMAWQVIVNDLGKPIGTFRGAQIMLVGSLGKYVPGSVWAYLLQMELGRKAGLPRARIFTGSLLNIGFSVVGSLVLGLFALPVMLRDSPGALWLFALLPLGLAALHPKVLTWGTSLVLRVLKRQPLDHTLRWRTIGKALGWVLAAYFCYGLHLWLLANAIGEPGLSGLVLSTGAMSLGLTIGLFAFVLPSGAGVREVVLVAALGTAMPTGQAMAFAAASRVMFMLADIVTAGAAALLARWRADREPQAAELPPVP